MTILYTSNANRIGVVEVDGVGNLTRVVQVVDPVVDPLPAGIDGKKLEGSPKLATEWISRHPKYDLLYALTSFWDKASAVLTTFRIHTDDGGRLEKLGRCDTEGYQAAHGTFSPDGSAYVVGHHNFGEISFFDASNDGPATKPDRVLELPVLKTGTRKEPGETYMGIGLPSVHGVSYSPSGKHLIVVDPVQNAVFTYEVNKGGRLTTHEHEATNPVGQLVCSNPEPMYGWMKRAMDWFLELGPRPRRAIVHPNGRYLYVLHETLNTLQVYAYDDETGKIEPNCLQQIRVADPDVDKARCIGLGATLSAEVEVLKDNEFRQLLVSNRGASIAGGRSESSVRTVRLREEGRHVELDAKEWLEAPGFVRHFAYQPAADTASSPVMGSKKRNVLWVGIESTSSPIVQKYVQLDDGRWELTGEANTGMPAMCVVPLEL